MNNPKILHKIPRCQHHNFTLEEYDPDLDIGWCTSCAGWIGDQGDWRLTFECRNCGHDLHIWKDYKPNEHEIDRMILDDACSSCDRSEPSLSAWERNV